MAMILFTATDAAYLPHARALLASFRHFHPEGACIVYAVDLPESDCDELRRFGARIASSVQTPDISSKMRAACWRFCALSQELPAHEDDVVVACDADTIIRGRLDSIADALQGGDVAIRIRRSRDPNRQVYAGILGIRSTVGARRFLQSYERLLNADEPTWYADQRSLFGAYCELKSLGQATFVDVVGIEMQRGRRLHDETLAWFPNASMRRTSKFKSASRHWQAAFAAVVTGERLANAVPAAGGDSGAALTPPAKQFSTVGRPSKKERTLEEVFTRIHDTWHWGGRESVSGRGSSMASAGPVVAALPGILERYSVKSVLDIPCGDFNWMRMVSPFPQQYVGADVVRALVDRNNRLYASEGRRFIHLDVTSSPLPKADLIFCRDCLVHFSLADAMAALRNIWSSGATYFMATTFPGHPENPDIHTGRWRPLNLQKEPFKLPEPLELISEQCKSKGYGDKSLALWRISDCKRP